MRKQGSRPLLAAGNARDTLARLIEERYPIYAEADHIVDTATDPPEGIALRIIDLLQLSRAPA